MAWVATSLTLHALPSHSKHNELLHLLMPQQKRSPLTLKSKDSEPETAGSAAFAEAEMAASRALGGGPEALALPPPRNAGSAGNTTASVSAMARGLKGPAWQTMPFLMIKHNTGAACWVVRTHFANILYQRCIVRTPLWEYPGSADACAARCGCHRGAVHDEPRVVEARRHDWKGVRMAPWGGQLRQACKAIGAAGAVKGADHAVTPCAVLRAASCSSRQRISQHILQNLSYLLVLLSCA